MNVIVLGCGPSGLVAAHAAVSAGCRVVIYSRKQKSAVLGAQFLHADIPGTNSPQPHFVEWYHRVGEDGLYNPENYLRKVYGPAWDGVVSPEMFNMGQQAWDLREVYRHLYARFEADIVDWYFSADALNILGRKLAGAGRNFLIINTLPRRVVCQKPGEHDFISTKIWAMGDDPTNGVACPFTMPDFTIEYNGNPAPAWYRVSKIFGHTTMEWPGHLPKPPVAGVVAVNKPVATTCTCWPGVVHVGRYGQWRKGVLLHHVYEDTIMAVNAARQEALF